MVTKEILSTLKAQLAELKAEYQATLGSESLSKNTIHTKSYNIRKDIKKHTVLIGLVSATTDEKLAMLNKDKAFADALGSILNPGTGGTIVEVKEGDSALALITGKYAGLKDVANRMEKAANKAGLKLDLASGKYIRI